MGKAPRPDEDGYPAFMNFVAQYASCDKAHQLFYDYVRFILTRTNRYTKKKYKDDPAIMSWQIGNEPRAFSKEQLPAFEKWLGETSKLIRSLDKNHLISIGSEGKWGCENELDCWERICADRNVDYCNIHLWPYNWSWARKDHLLEDLGVSCKNTKEYIDEHLAVCGRIRKPLVMEVLVTVSPSLLLLLQKVVMVIISMSSVLLATMPPLVVILPVATSGAGVVLPSRSTSSGR